MTATTPGLVCAHHHLDLGPRPGDARPAEDPTCFQEILEQIWWRLDCAEDLEMIRWSAMLGALEALERGPQPSWTTTSRPHAIEGSLDAIATACAEVGVRVGCAYGSPTATAARGQRGLEENRRFLEAGGRAWWACTWPSPATGRRGGRRRYGGRSGVGVHIHVAEGGGDVEAADRLAGHPRRLAPGPRGAPARRPPAEGNDPPHPRSNLNNVVDAPIPAGFAQPVALGTDGIGGQHDRGVPPGLRAASPVDVTATPKTAWRWLEAGWDLVPEARQDRVAWSYDPMDPWVSLSPPASGRCGWRWTARWCWRTGGPPVDAAEVRAKAREQAARLHARL